MNLESLCLVVDFLQVLFVLLDDYAILLLLGLKFYEFGLDCFVTFSELLVDFVSVVSDSLGCIVHILDCC